MGLFSKLSEKRMKDPVEGTVRVVGITTPNPNATQENYRLDGVVSGPGIEPTAIIHKGFTNVSKWPYVGQELPVTVDRADPTHISIHWDRLSTSHEIAQQQTEALAAQMRGQQPAGGAPGAAAPGFGDPSAINLTFTSDDGSTWSPGPGGAAPEPEAPISSADILARGTAGSATLLGTFPGETPPIAPAHTIIGLMLNVMVDGHPPYQVTALYNTPDEKIPKLTIGALLPVKADPKQPDLVAVDWDAV